MAFGFHIGPVEIISTKEMKLWRVLKWHEILISSKSFELEALKREIIPRLLTKSVELLDGNKEGEWGRKSCFGFVFFF